MLRLLRNTGRSAFWRSLALLAGLFIVLPSTSPAAAAKFYFGTQEHLARLQDVAIRGPKGEELYLGYKYSFHSLLLPYSVSDDGYILGIKGEHNTYYRLDKAGGIL